MERKDVEAAVRAHLGLDLERGDLDLFSDSEGELDLAADNWTIHLERLPSAPWGFLALDDEPDDPNEYDTAIRRAFPPARLTALIAIDRDLRGELATALSRSGDELTTAFVAALARGET
jgi:hypothetical protein